MSHLIALPPWKYSIRGCSSLLLSFTFGIFYHINSLVTLWNNRGQLKFVEIDNFYLNTINVLSRQPLSYFFGLYSPDSNVGTQRINPFPLGEYLFSIIKNLTAMSLVETYVVTSIFCTALMFFFFLRITLLYIPNQLTATLLTFSGLNLTFTDGYTLIRPISPTFNALVWLIFLYTLLSTLRCNPEGFGRPRAHLSFTACLLLGSPYYVILSVTCYLLFLLHIYRNRVKLKHIPSSGSLRFLILNNFLLALFMVYWRIGNSNKQYWKDYSERLGLVESHLPSAKSVIVIAGVSIALLLLITPIQEFSETKRFLLWVNVTLILVSNSNVVTGLYLQFSDHFNQIARILFFVSLLELIQALRLARINHFLPILLCCMLILSTVQQFMTLQSKPIVVANPASAYSNILLRISSLPSNANLLSDLDLETLDLISIHGNLNLVYSGNTSLYPISNQELTKRLHLYRACRPIDRSFLLNNEAEILVYAYSGQYYKELTWKKYLSTFGLSDLVKPQKNEPLVQEFINFSQILAFKDCFDLIKEFESDYILTDNLDRWTNIIKGDFDVQSFQNSVGELFLIRLT